MRRAIELTACNPTTGSWRLFLLCLIFALNLARVACIPPINLNDDNARLKHFFPPPSATDHPKAVNSFTSPSNESLFSNLFRAFAPSFTDAEAREKALLSAAAYCHNLTTLFDWSCLPCNNLSDVHPIRIISDANFNTFGFVAIKKSLLTPVIIVAFRGTCGNIPNVEVDTDARTISPWKDHPDVRVHWGFYRAYESVRIQMLAGIKEAMKALPLWMRPFVTLELTGHSLGASLATIAAVDIKRSMENLEDVPIKLFTFGSPRVGNPLFAALVSKAVKWSYRVTHWEDPIVHLPIRGSIWGNYLHTGQEVFYNHDFSGYKVCSSNPGEDVTCASQFSLPIDLYDHLHYFGMRVGTYCDDGP